MKQTKRLLSLLLALLLCAVSLGALAEFAYTGEGPITDQEGVSVSMLAMNSWYSTVDLKDAVLLKEIADRASITIDWNLIDPTIYADTVSPMLAAGTDLPDIIELPDLDPNMTYLSSGMFVALDEYFDLMPNYSKYLSEHPEVKATLTATDGHIYYVPQTAVPNNYQPMLMLNMPWLEQLGLEVPKTVDEFVDMLRLFKENDMNGNGDAGDEIPMSVQSAFLPYLFGPAFGLDLVSGFYADDDGVVRYAQYDSEKYLNYLTFLNGLYNEGLLEIEFTSLTRDMTTERFAQDLTGATFDYSWQMSNLYSAQYPQYDGAEGIVVGVPPLSGEYEGYYVGRNAVSGIFGVNSKAADIEMAVKFLDYAMGEDSQDLYVWGMEDLTYTVDAEGNRAYLPRCTEDTIWYQGLGINAPCMPSQQSVPATDVLLPAWHVQVDKESEEPYIRSPFPATYASEEEASILSMYLVDIETYVDESSVSFISGYTSLDTFENYLNTLKNMQVEELIAVRQAQYSRYMEAFAD